MKGIVLPKDMNVAQVDMPPITCGLNSCAMMNATCGPIGDGCGGVIQCGDCAFPSTCGGGGTPFQCGGMAACPKLTCAKLMLNCGPAGDGCGNTIDCGGCPMGMTCGGGGVNGQCGTPGVSSTDMANGGCVPRTCGTQNCGQIGDGCGKLITCGPNNGLCPNPGESCGGGGQPGVCGKPACTKLTCAQFNYNCGTIGDGCGGTLDCSNGMNCPAGTSCGGGGKPNVCGKAACTPKTCAQQGFNCGTAGDTCGNTLDCSNGNPDPCMTGTTGNTCGGGGQPNVCGKPTCTPKSCSDQGFNCGVAGDGCGFLIPGGCGSCMLPDVCGANKPNVCGNNNPDGGVTGNCPGGGSTTITGTVLAATDSSAGFGNPDPIPNAVIYVPSKPLTAITTGATCEQCTNTVSALVETTSNVDGTFTLVNPPTGPAVTVVIQLGKWRRVLTVAVAACKNNALTAAQTRLPRKQAEFSPFDNIPRFAINTGDVDAMECVLRKMGVADSEFSDPSLNGSGVPQSTARVHLYRSIPTSNGNGAPGARYDANTPSNSTLVGNAPVAPSGATPGAYLGAYDAVLFPCTGGEDDKTKTQVDNVINYSNVGGRVFLTHYSYVWAFNDSPWGCFDTATGTNCTTANSSVATWDPDTQYTGTFQGIIDQTFPKGVLLKNWLQNLGIGGATTYGAANTPGYQIPVRVVRWDADAVLYGQQWLFSADPPNQGPQQFPIHFTFNTPVFQPAANQCGRVVYSDFHVENISGGHKQTFPNECGANAPLTAQEKLLEFMLFDLTSCVSPDIPTCTPATCQPGQCGMLGDGCGKVLNCPPCAPGQVCGGGGVPNQCAGGCTKLTCAQLGYTCGLWGDGCGGTLDCCPGGNPANGMCCTNGQTCGGGGVTGQCGGGCTPLDCAALGANCGVQGNGCGGIALPNPCGTCTGNQTCGGGGIPNQCGGGCTPLTCQQLGLNCGPAGDGCGGLIPNGCGTCPMGQMCGGGGVPGVCGAPPDGGVMCQPLDCKTQGLSCGKAGDGCGNLIDCGPCPTGQTCGGGGTPGKCGAPNCTPTTCAAAGKNCGIIGDGCGGTVDCGVCMSPETCGGGGIANVCGRIL